MFASLKKLMKWNSDKMESKTNQTSLLLAAFIGLLEDILLWKKMWLSLSCIFLLNLLFIVCIHREITILQFVSFVGTTVISIDAFEAWLKYKHRTSGLKRLVNHNGSTLNTALLQINRWLKRRWMEYNYLRRTNHTKAFLMVNIILIIVFFIGKYLSEYVVMYLLCMMLCVLHKVAPVMQKLAKQIQQNAESDGELEGLIPEITEVDIKLLSIEPEHQLIDDRQSLDYWKPEDLPLEEASDSSENSSSLITNLSIERMNTLEKDVETSDSSEDEYIPLERKEQLQSTLEVVPPESWSSTAYSALFNLTGAVANMVYSKSESKRKRVSSIDSSDGFEIIDKSDLM